MKVSELFFMLEKILKYLDEDVFPVWRRYIVLLERWKYVETSIEERLDDTFAPDYDESAWANFCVPSYWAEQGGYDRVAWSAHAPRFPLIGWNAVLLRFVCWSGYAITAVPQRRPCSM